MVQQPVKQAAATNETVKTWVVVAQVKSYRVVYYTDDPEYQPPIDGDWYFCSQYRGALPKEMTLKNCWGWRFNGGVFTDAREKPGKSTAQLLIDNNRAALHQLLRNKVNAARDPYLPVTVTGEFLRREKLAEADAYLAAATKGTPDADTETTYPLLMGVATSRNISLREAAHLVKNKAAEARAFLVESERTRERYKHEINNAKTDAELVKLREYLMDDVFPNLSARFRFDVANTEPINRDAAMPDHHRVHETTRLKVQLREAINAKRREFQSAYIQDDVVRREKLDQARAFLADKTRAPGELLDAFAKSRKLDMAAAADHLVKADTELRGHLAKTEKIKDELFAQIDAAKTMADIDKLSKAVLAV
jgi:hypothetical protein